jgi:hypothetical protein
MKRFFTLLIGLIAIVGTAGATNNVTIYFKPNSKWAEASARFIAALYDSGGSHQGWVSFTYDSTHECYFAEIDTDVTPKFQLVRKNPATSDLSYDNKWGQTPSEGFGDFPTSEAFIYLTGDNVDGASWNTSLLPWCYYFYGNWGSKNAWCVGDKLTTSGDVHTGTLSGMADKYFVIYQGSQINYWSNTHWDDNSWNNAIRPTESKTIGFESIGITNTTTGGSNSWYINSANEGNVHITYNSSENKYSVACTKSTIIGSAGYITYSNEEKCTISGADAIYVIDVNNSTSVHMAEKAASTVWPAKEGMILKGNNGDVVTINSVGSDATEAAIGTNYLVGSGNGTLAVTAGTGKYVFNWDGSDPSTVGFYLANSGTLGAHKAYLDISSLGGAHEFLGFEFDDETTGVKSMNVERLTLDEHAPVFNLAGQRVSENYKGVVIQNGKKFVK